MINFTGGASSTNGKGTLDYSGIFDENINSKNDKDLKKANNSSLINSSSANNKNQ
jgi:hypothetical protein